VTVDQADIKRLMDELNFPAFNAWGYELMLKFYEHAQREAYEKAAITAWNHFMDRCNYSNCHPADEGPWCAATAIRKLKEES